jgi:hypothetical protein
LELDVGQLLDGAAERLLPAGVNQVQVSISGANATVSSNVEAIPLV